MSETDGHAARVARELIRAARSEAIRPPDRPYLERAAAWAAKRVLDAVERAADELAPGWRDAERRTER